MVDRDLPPGANAGQEQIVENDLTGGRKGGGFMGASVAGAGIQTADDPFGLKVTETAPPAAGEHEVGKQFNWSRWYNILIMIVAFLVAGAVAATGVYFGFLSKKTASTIDPVETVKEYCKQVISGDTTNLGDVSAPGSLYQKELSDVIAPYEKLGVLSMKDFQATATNVTATKATVEIKKFVIKSLNTSGDTENLDLLTITDPALLRTTVSLVKQNGKWLVFN